MLDNTKRNFENTTVSQAKVSISDLVTFGDCDAFKLICKSSSETQGWMKSTKALEISGVGCLVQVTTLENGRPAEALCFIPGVKLELIEGDKLKGRKLVKI
jgi:hypothetical protein